jgi:hypothetical protein
MEEKRGKSYCLWEMQLLCNTWVLEPVSHSEETYWHDIHCYKLVLKNFKQFIFWSWQPYPGLKWSQIYWHIFGSYFSVILSLFRIR